MSAYARLAPAVEEAPIFSRIRVRHRTAINDRALSKRERGRSRFPHREPIGLHPRARVGRALLEREKNDPAASPYLKAIDSARNPRTSRAAHQAGVFAERPSNPERAAEHRPADSEAGSMRCCGKTALDRWP